MSDQFNLITLVSLLQIGLCTKPWITEGHYCRNPWSKVKFEDWTLDEVPEIIFDARLPYCGTDIGGEMYLRYVIHCQQVECNIVWNGITNDYYWQNGTNVGMRLYQVDTSASQIASNVILEATSTQFAINCSQAYCPLSLGNTANDPWNTRSVVDSSVLTRYLWNGFHFVEIERILISEPQVIEPKTILEAQSSDKKTRTY